MDRYDAIVNHSSNAPIYRRPETPPLTVVTALLVALIAGIVSAPRPAEAHEQDVYTFTGSGWGHSIGLSQYGAYGQALDGATAEEIVDYYYDGVAVQTLDELVDAVEIDDDHPLMTDETPVWVGLRQSETLFELTPVGGDVELCQRVDGDLLCVDVGWDEGVAETWLVQTAQDNEVAGCLVTKVDPEPGDPPIGFGSCEITISWGAEWQAERVTLDGDVCTETGVVGRECLGRGTLHVRSDAVESGFHILLELGVEEYMYGLGEMPSSWPDEALKAQTLAGRSYLTRRVLARENPELATATSPGLTESRKAACWCHLYSTSLDQNYVGHAKESDATYSQRWIDAVDATAGEVITHPAATPGTVILAFYHSSSGGHTETNETVWGTTALAYLQPVPDPWSNSEAVNNPYAQWTIAVTDETLAAEMEWDELTHVIQTAFAPDGQFELRGVLDGGVVVETRSAGWMYYAVGARSPHFESVAVDRFAPFLDMDGTGHRNAIYAIWEAGITTGCGDDYYCPDDPVTRAQMATFLARALDLAPVEEGPFTDIEDTGLHKSSINAVAQEGISLGCALDLFCPDALVTRAQMASFLARALGLESIETGPFTDLVGVGSHRTSINAIAEAGISLGCAEGLFCPHAVVNRAQMASFLARAFVWVDDSEASSPEEESVSPS